MTVRLRSFHPHLNVYHHQPGLLFQFILSDYLEIHREAKALQLLTTAPRTPAQFERYFSPIRKLAGASQDTMRFFAWSRDNSLLSKFKTYCALYTQHQKHLKRSLSLQQNANQSWLYCMQCLDLLHALKEEGQNPKTAESLCKITGKLLTCLNRISKTLIPLFEAYSDDENVLFFILRRCDSLDEIYGEGFVFQMLSKMHPEGLSGIEMLLIERFSKRGFDPLLPIIKASFELVAVV